MTLTAKEKWVHYFSLISAFGFIEHIPRDELIELADRIRHERCRHLSREEADSIIKEIGEESLHGQIVLNDLLATLREEMR